MADEQATRNNENGGTAAREQFTDREVTIHFGKGLASPFRLKDGREMLKISIPNTDPQDKSSWAYFLLPAKAVHENQYGKGLWAKLPLDGATIISKPVPVGKEGTKTIWGRDQIRITNEELKAVVESYRTKERPSVLDQLGKAREEGRESPARPPGRKQAKYVGRAL